MQTASGANEMLLAEHELRIFSTALKNAESHSVEAWLVPYRIKGILLCARGKPSSLMRAALRDEVPISALSTVIALFVLACFNHFVDD